jgi:hypothetical protein
MKTLLVLVALLASACGEMTQPSTPTVSFGVQVVTHSGRPVVGEAVTLVMPASATHQDVGPRTVRTNAAGLASWQVEPGHIYPLLIRERVHFDAVRVPAASQWLLSVPD